MPFHSLFSTFPREVLALTRANDHGVKIPNRSIVLSQKELDLFIQKHSGVQDPYVGVFEFKGTTGSTSVDKLFYDFDDEHSKYAPILAKWLYENKIGYVVVGTYFDRYHIYIPIIQQVMTSLELLEAQQSILEQAGIYKKVCSNCGAYLGEPMSCHDKERGCSGKHYYQLMADTHVLGDIRRVLRVPNTPRLPKRLGGEITCYCVYLPQNFYEMDKAQLYSLYKSPQEMELPDYNPEPIYNIAKPLTRQFRSIIRHEMEDNAEQQYVPTDPLLKFVQSMLRPCIWRSMISANPPHFVRVAATIDLRDLGFSRMQIFDIFSRLEWIDWNAEVCDYQISNLLGKANFKRYSCTKIKTNGVPCDPECSHKHNGSHFVPIDHVE